MSDAIRDIREVVLPMSFGLTIGQLADKVEKTPRAFQVFNQVWEKNNGIVKAIVNVSPKSYDEEFVETSTEVLRQNLMAMLSLHALDTFLGKGDYTFTDAVIERINDGYVEHFLKSRLEAEREMNPMYDMLARYIADLLKK